MTGDLVTGAGNTPDEARRTLGDPAEHEKSTTDALLGEQIQDALGVALDAILAGRPALAGDRGGQRCHLEVVLHINRKRVERSVQLLVRLGGLHGEARFCHLIYSRSAQRSMLQARHNIRARRHKNRNADCIGRNSHSLSRTRSQNGPVSALFNSAPCTRSPLRRQPTKIANCVTHPHRSPATLPSWSACGGSSTSATARSMRRLRTSS